MAILLSESTFGEDSDGLWASERRKTRLLQVATAAQVVGTRDAHAVVKKLLHPRTGMFADKAFLTNEAGSRFVGILAEADPEAALALLRTIFEWPDDEIR